MGFAAVIGQVFLAIMFMLIFTQLFIVQNNQNKLQTQIYAYQKEQLNKQIETKIDVVSTYYNSSWNTTSIQLRNVGSIPININTSDLYVDEFKFDRNFTNRKWSACYEFTSARCGEIRFGDSVNGEETNLVLLFHFNNDSQWRPANTRLLESYSPTINNDLTANNLWLNVSGVFDRSYYFDGVTGYANRTNTAQNTFTNTSSYTWAFWIYPLAYGNPTRTLVSKNAAATGYSIYMNASGNIIFQSPNGGYLYNSTRRVQLNQWNHVAVVFQGTATGQVRFYLNGTSVTNLSHLSFLRTDANQFNIGRNVSSADSYYFGLIDEFALYTVVKTDAEIKSLYRKGVYASGKYVFDPEELLEIDIYRNLSPGTHTATYATKEGVSVTSEFFIP